MRKSLQLVVIACGSLTLGGCSSAPTSTPSGTPPGVASLSGTPMAASGSNGNGAPGPAGSASGAPGVGSEGLGMGDIAISNPDPANNAGGSAAPPVDCSIPSSAAISVAWSAIQQQQPAWYATPEALSLAENILYYQNVDHGWPKNIDMTTRTTPLDDESTIDNRGTTTQIEYLSRVYTAFPCPRYGASASAGIQYLLEAQYANGGWPQTYPNPTDYHSHITYNDDAMVRVLNLLRVVARRAEPYAFADDALLASAAAAVDRGIDCILKTQIVIDGTKTGWCAQHDEVTLAPAQARTYELPSLSGSEGAGLFRFLMTIDEPSPEIREAVQAAAAWFEAVKLTGIRVANVTDATQPEGQDRVVVEDPAAPPLWARFYEIGTNRPIFSSRCEVPECADDPLFMRRYSLAEIDNERRVGYAWYGNWPNQLLTTTYPAWQARWAP